MDESREDRRKVKDMRQTHGILVKYRGGSETYWELSYSGRTYRLHGSMMLHDALALVVTGELDYGQP